MIGERDPGSPDCAHGCEQGLVEGDVTLRRATEADRDMVFRWRNLPEIVALGSSQTFVTPEEHAAWFAKTLADPSWMLLIILLRGEPIGQVRFEPGVDGTRETSIYLLPEYVGHGLGTAALRKAVWTAFAGTEAPALTARVLETNARSIAAFRRAGFEPVPSAGGLARHVLLRRERPPVVPHSRLTFGREEEAAAAAVVRSGQWAGGPRLAELESALARAAGVDHAVGVASGLAALRLSLLALGVGPGDRVLVPAYTCVALPDAVLACGAEPVPVDVSDPSWNLDTNEDPPIRPAAVIGVHTFGVPADIAGMRRWGAPVIEDCAHAFGFDVDGAPVGSLGDVAIMSFYATKLVGAGEGGAVLTNNAASAARVRDARDYVDKSAAATHLNDKMTDIEAALASCQLERLPEMLAARERLAARYDPLLRDAAQASGEFRLPTAQAPRAWYRYAVELHEKPAKMLAGRMRRFGVRAESPTADWLQPETPDLQTARRAYERVLSLPLYPTLTEEEQDRVVYAFLSALEEV